MGAKIQLSTTEPVVGTRLVYCHDLPKTNPKRRRAEFRCTCGRHIEADVNYVRFLNVTSCGCYKTELLTAKNTKHGAATRETKTGAYRSFTAMHQRVKVNPLYKARQVCERWSGEDGFRNFLADMGERPEGLSIERKDNQKGYSPDNCIWADKVTQATNSTNTVFVTLDGVTNSIHGWCRLKGISYGTFKARRQAGLTVEEALTTKLNESKSHVR